MNSDDQQWLIYRCLDPECGTLVYVGARAGRVPEEQRECLDCGGVAALQEEPRQRGRRDESR
jgi:hypothetical protein